MWTNYKRFYFKSYKSVSLRQILIRLKLHNSNSFVDGCKHFFALWTSPAFVKAPELVVLFKLKFSRCYRRRTKRKSAKEGERTWKNHVPCNSSVHESDIRSRKTSDVRSLLLLPVILLLLPLCGTRISCRYSSSTWCSFLLLLLLWWWFVIAAVAASSCSSISVWVNSLLVSGKYSSEVGDEASWRLSVWWLRLCWVRNT